jgi:hypothetical protein
MMNAICGVLVKYPCSLKEDARLMTTKNVKDFLNDFSPEELINRDILNYSDNRLNNLSVQPLVALMKEKEIGRLEWPSHKWFFEVNGNFGNKNVNYLKETSKIFGRWENCSCT